MQLEISLAHIESDQIYYFRQIPQAAASMKEGKWDRKKVRGWYHPCGNRAQDTGRGIYPVASG